MKDYAIFTYVRFFALVYMSFISKYICLFVAIYFKLEIQICLHGKFSPKLFLMLKYKKVHNTFTCQFSPLFVFFHLTCISFFPGNNHELNVSSVFEMIILAKGSTMFAMSVLRTKSYEIVSYVYIVKSIFICYNLVLKYLCFELMTDRALIIDFSRKVKL